MSQDLSVSYTPQFVSLVLTGNKTLLPDCLEGPCEVWGEHPVPVPAEMITVEVEGRAVPVHHAVVARA